MHETPARRDERIDRLISLIDSALEQDFEGDEPWITFGGGEDIEELRSLLQELMDRRHSQNDVAGPRERLLTAAIGAVARDLHEHVPLQDNLADLTGRVLGKALAGLVDAALEGSGESGEG